MTHEPQQEEYVIVAEDSAPNRTILVHLLKRMGFKVLDFENGQKAWECLQQSTNKKIIAVLSDIMMPEMNGVELLRHIRTSEKYQTIPVVLITALTEKEYTMEAKKLKVNGYLLKPVTSERLRAKFKDLFPNKTFNQVA